MGSMKDKQAKIECQGRCKEHRGMIQRVEVRDIRNSKNWGLFSYCDEAIEEDRRRGLDVSIIDHVPSFPLSNKANEQTTNKTKA